MPHILSDLQRQEPQQLPVLCGRSLPQLHELLRGLRPKLPDLQRSRPYEMHLLSNWILPELGFPRSLLTMLLELRVLHQCSRNKLHVLHRRILPHHIISTIIMQHMHITVSDMHRSIIIRLQLMHRRILFNLLLSFLLFPMRCIMFNMYSRRSKRMYIMCSRRIVNRNSTCSM